MKEEKVQIKKKRPMRKMSLNYVANVATAKKDIYIMISLIVVLIGYIIWSLDTQEMCYGVIMDAGSSGTKV